MSDEHSTMEDGPRLPAPVEQVVELLVYAPLGFLLEAPSQFPACVERGRREIGQLHGWLGRRAHDAVRESTAALRGLGLMGRPPVAEPDAPPSPPNLSVVPDVPDEAATTEPHRDEPAAPPGPSIDAEHLAIPDYESLSASQVVPRLVSLTAEELEQIRRYESAARGRKTILSRISQLQAG
jgi:hypothetical protein